MITLKNWSLVVKNSPYQAPELGDVCLRGISFGHPKHDDGTVVVTTPIVKKEFGVITTRSGSEYTLLPGEVNPEYEVLYPNAFKRIFGNRKD
jgi:hypothetical protein